MRHPILHYGFEEFFYEITYILLAFFNHFIFEQRSISLNI